MEALLNKLLGPKCIEGLQKKQKSIASSIRTFKLAAT